MNSLLRAGALGNTFRTWSSIAMADADGYVGLYGLRLNIKAAQGFNGDMTRQEALDIEAYLIASGQAEFASFSEHVPNQYSTIRCEVCLTPIGLYLRYREGPGYMRAAMNNPLHLSGIQAKMMLVKHFGHDGFRDIKRLLETYDGVTSDMSATVEAASFSVPVGPERKYYVIWEVRAY